MTLWSHQMTPDAVTVTVTWSQWKDIKGSRMIIS